MEIRFGEYRDAHSFREKARVGLRRRLHELLFDLKYAIRIYRNRWFTTALAILSLGLAIGASTGIFSILNALLLRGLPFSNPAQLTELLHAPVTALRGRSAFTDWQNQCAYLQSAATFSSSEMNLAGEQEALRVKAAETSANFFSLLGVQPAVGRTFAPDEDMPGHNAVAVISFGLWQQLFGGRPGVQGEHLHVNGALVTVIGVTPAGFDYPGKTNLWMPTAFELEKVPKRGAFFFQTIGRLKQGISIRAARGLFESEVQRYEPGHLARTNADNPARPRLTSLQDQLAGPVGKAGWVLAALSLLVLLTACANVAQLLLSRAMERRAELELRAAFGAGSSRLVQQLITEAMCLTVMGSALGLLVARWTAGIAASAAPAQLAAQGYTVLDWRVLCFAAALAVMMGCVFGVLPALLMGRLQPSERLVRMQATPENSSSKRVRAGLVGLQAAFGLCLLTSSLAMGRTFLRLLDVDLGFHPANVVTLSISLQGTRHRGAGEWQYYREALNRLRAIPGVQTAGAVSYLPLAANAYMAGSFKLDSGQRIEPIVMNAATPDYFRSMGTSFLAGNDFVESGGRPLERLVIVNEAVAQSTGLGTKIVGRRVFAPWSAKPYLITGVVSTARAAGPAYSGGPQIFFQIQEEPPAAITFVASVRDQPEAYLARARYAIRAEDPQVPIYDVATMERRVADVLGRPRLYTTAIAFLAVLSVILAAIGTYGTAAYSIAQRRHEIGVRMAVGASYQGVRWMILREGMLPILAGAVVGMGLSVASGRYLEHLLESAAQPAVWACLSGAGLLVLIGLLAVWSATSRVLSIDPATSLRAE